MARNMLFLMCLVLFQPHLPLLAAGDECNLSGSHDAITVLLIDGSDSNALDERLDQTLHNVNNIVMPNERLLVSMIMEKRAASRIVVDIVNPAESVWESKLVFRKKQKAYADCLSSIATKVPRRGAQNKVAIKKVEATAILETLSFIREVLNADQSKRKRIVIYSDMIQNSDFINFYKLGPKDTPEVLIDRTAKEGLIPNLSGAEVHVAGIGGAQTDKQARFAEKYWRLFFEKAGANLRFYGPVLVN